LLSSMFYYITQSLEYRCAEADRCDAHLDTGKRDDDESTIGGTQTCAICMTGTKSHVAVPCGHLCACAGCASQLMHCPVCRTKVDKWMKVHIA